VNQPSRGDTSNQCPPLEQMASYLDRTLDPVARARFESHVADCDDCRELLAESARTLDAVPELALPRRSWRPVVFYGGLAAAVLFMAVWLRGPSEPPDAVRPQLVELVAALRTVPARPIEARLTGGFAYAPPPATERGPASSVPVDVQMAALTIQKRAESEDTPENAAALGVARLVVGDYDAAIDRLTSAVGRDPSLIHAWSDLSAAYLARGGASDLVRALDAARRATEGAQPPPEAWFNFALAAERLGLSDEARRAWNQVIVTEPGSGWAEEARRRIAGRADIGGARNGERRSSDRERLETDLLPRWAQAVLSSDARAQTDALIEARAAADALATATGDAMLVAVVAAIQRPGTRARDLAEGHLAYARGRQLQDRDQVSDAGAAYKEAVAKLDRLTPYADWAALWWIAVERDTAGADQRLAAILERAETESFHNMTGRAQWLTGLRAGIAGDFARSLRAYQTAAAAFARTGEHEWSNSIRGLVAEAHELLGDYDTAWDHRVQSLVYADTTPVRPAARWALIGGAFRAALRQRLDGAAAALQDGLLHHVQQSGTPVTVAQQFVARARVRAERGDAAGAGADLSAADAQLHALNDARVKSTVGVEVQIERALLAATPEQRVEALTTALAGATTAQLSFRYPALYRARALAHVDLGAFDAARDDLTAARAATSKQRAALTSMQLRYSSFHETWPIFVESARVPVLAGDRSCDAFDTIEAGRLEAMAVRPLRPPATLGELTARLAAGVTVVAYVAGPDRTLAWTVSSTRCVLHDLPVSDTALTIEVDALMRAIAAAPDAWKASAGSLHGALIAPLRASLMASTSLVIIPDGVTARIPFAMLLDPATNRVVAEQFTLTLSPSVSTWLSAVDRASSRASSPAPVVVAVGNPQPSDERGLPDLPYAAAEASEVAGMFPGAMVITGPIATRGRFLQAIARSEILHFSGHAVSNDRLPWMSRLILASDSSDRTAIASVLGYELQDARWSHLRLAFLSACSTAGSTGSGSAGWFGFATPLLASGVPVVIATLWNVNDRETRLVAHAFYRQLKAGVAPAAALQRAQVELIRSGAARGAVSWAAFVVVGAGDQPLVTRNEETQ
jgi:CHAT domain-containing protein